MPSSRSTVDVLQLVSTAQRRGAQVHALAMSRLLRERGLSVDDMAVVRGPGDLGGFQVAGPGRIRALPSIRRSSRSVGVVVANGSMALPAAAIASGAAPVVYRNIGDPSFWLARPSRRWRVRQYLRRVAHVVALWSGARDYYVDMGFPADRITVIPNGVDADLWPAPIGEEALAARRALGLDPGEPIVAFVGALGREKNVGLALAAMERLPDARLVVVGDGPEEHLVRQAMASGRRVSHLAAREDVRPVYLASDVLLSTSRSEGMPGVIIEAALTERPAVATAVGAVPDMIEDGLSGFVLADFDAETLADAVLRVLADGPDRGLTARQLALQRFDLRRLANEWVDLVGRLSK